jgi:hypothetical protein
MLEDFMMRSWLVIFSIFTAVFLAGCTTAPTVVRSEVTVFHEWPANLQNATFTFDPTAEQQNNLEYQAYASLIREELQRLGFRPADNPAAADLVARFQYGITSRDVRIVEPMMVDPGFPLFSPYWGRYGPYYDPFWHPGYVDRYETQYVLYTRKLHITISQASTGRNLYDVTVVSEGRRPTLAGVMPYMVKSAFADFPGPSGVPRRIELTIDKESGKIQPVQREEVSE